MIENHSLNQANLDDSIASGSFSVIGYLPLIWKDSSTHMNGRSLYAKEGLPFARDLCLENSADSYLCFWLAVLYSVSYFFYLYQSPSLSISCNIDDVLSINLSANIFVFGDLNIHHKDWLTYSRGTDWLVNSAIIFLSEMTLLRWLTFLLKSQPSYKSKPILTDV